MFNKKLKEQVTNLNTEVKTLQVATERITNFNELYDKILESYNNSKALINEQMLQYDKKIIENSAVVDERMLQFSKKIDDAIDNTMEELKKSLKEQNQGMREELDKTKDNLEKEVGDFVKKNQEIIKNNVNDCKETLDNLLESNEKELNQRFNDTIENHRKIWNDTLESFTTEVNTTLNKYELNLNELIKKAVALELNNLAIEKIVVQANDEILKAFNKSLVELNQQEKNSIIDAIKGLLIDKLPIHYINEEKEQPIEPLGEDEIFHKSYEKMKTCILAGIVPMLVGPAGTGKSTAAKQLARDLGLNFYMANRIQNTFELLGFVDAKGDYVKTQFYEAFTKGGLFLFDEVDASSPEALVTVNAALAQGYMAFPGHPQNLHMHKDFKVICAGNTSGKGSTLQYTGRNVLDAATLDRFMIIDWGYDKTMEDNLVQDKDLLEACWKLRDVSKPIDKNIIISTRGIIIVEKMIKQNETSKSYLISNIFKTKFFDGISKEKFKAITQAFANVSDKNKYYKFIMELAE